MDWTTLLVVVFGSAVIAAFVSGGFQLWADARKRQHEERKGSREAHAAAREQLMPQLIAVIAYVDDQIRQEAEERVGIEVVYHPQPDTQVRSWSEALGVLRQIALVHPTATVRAEAERLRSVIQGAWIDPQQDVGEWKQLHDWSSRLAELARLMHLY